MEALGVSTGLIVGWCALAQIARKVSQRMIKEEGLIQTLVNEAIAAAELCACCFELIISKVVDFFNFFGYPFFLFQLLTTLEWLLMRCFCSY